jgi:hypothetical protein
LGFHAVRPIRFYVQIEVEAWGNMLNEAASLTPPGQGKSR